MKGFQEFCLSFLGVYCLKKTWVFLLTPRGPESNFPPSSCELSSWFWVLTLGPSTAVYLLFNTVENKRSWASICWGGYFFSTISNGSESSYTNLCSSNLVRVEAKHRIELRPWNAIVSSFIIFGLLAISCPFCCTKLEVVALLTCQFVRRWANSVLLGSLLLCTLPWLN